MRTKRCGVTFTTKSELRIGRISLYNTRRLLHTISSPCPDTPEVTPSLDAEKAFGRVLFYVMETFGFSSDFIVCIRLLYTNFLSLVLLPWAWGPDPLLSTLAPDTDAPSFPLYGHQILSHWIWRGGENLRASPGWLG